MLWLLKYFKNENKRVTRRYIPNCIMSVHNIDFVHIVYTITYIGCIWIDILNIYIKNISNQWIEWKTSHKATVNWNGKGWKIHQMKVIFHKCSLFQTPSQQGAILENDQEGVTGSSQWAPYSLGRRDVPPDNLIKKVFNELFACFLHRCFTNNLYFVCAFQKNGSCLL